MLDQLERYSKWLRLGQDGAGTRRIDEVLTAYRRAAVVLESLAVLTGKAECDARALWRDAAMLPLRAIVRPAIVIGNYCAQGDAARTTSFAAKAGTFHANGHERKVADHIVNQYHAHPAEPLPFLTGESLPA